MGRTMIKVVFAVGMDAFHENLAFGNKQGLPWDYCSQDLAMFKENTLNSVLLMGANTFKSLPGKLPQRLHCVLSSTTQGLKTRKGDLADQVIHGGTLSDAISFLNTMYPEKDICIIGGKGVIMEALSLQLADVVYITTMIAHKGEYDQGFERDVEFDSEELLELLHNGYTSDKGVFIELDGHKQIDDFTVRLWEKK